MDYSNLCTLYLRTFSIKELLKSSSSGGHECRYNSIIHVNDFFHGDVQNSRICVGKDKDVLVESFNLHFVL